MVKFKIGNRFVGDGEKPFVIAEVGVNYENDMHNAEQLIIAAKCAGADAVKFQTYRADRLVAKDAPKYWDDKQPEESQRQFFERSNKFYHDEMEQLISLGNKHNIMVFSTPFDLESVEILHCLEVPAFKIASADITNYPLLEAVADTDRPILLSTGASSGAEIRKAVRLIQERGNMEIVILHCILSYPTKPKDANLAMIPSLREKYPECVIGWSDHVIPEGEILAPTLAVALGASIVEKHFTLDKTLEGNDHYHSADTKDMVNIVSNVNDAWEFVGTMTCRMPLQSEHNARLQARRSIAAKVDIPIGTEIQMKHLRMLRPGTGMNTRNIRAIIGLKTTKFIPEGQLLEWNDFDY